MSAFEIRRMECDQCGARVDVGNDQYPKGWVEIEVAARQQKDDPEDKHVLEPVDQDSGDFCGLACAKAFLLAFAERLPVGDKGAT